MGSLLVCFLLLGFVSQGMVTPAFCRSLGETTLKPDCDCPTPSHHHGGQVTPTPAHGTPSHGGSAKPTPSTPSTPPHGGGYYPSPSSHPPPVIVDPPSTPVTPTPTIPVTPTPSTPDPTGPPYSPGSCSYWISNPGAIWAILGYWGTIGQSFGEACSSAFGKSMSLEDALKNTRSDGVGALYREGTAALLNSMACKKYSFTTQQVKDAFAAAIVSDKAASAQAEIFKNANEGGVKH